MKLKSQYFSSLLLSPSYQGCQNHPMSLKQYDPLFTHLILYKVPKLLQTRNQNEAIVTDQQYWTISNSLLCNCRTDNCEHSTDRIFIFLCILHITTLISNLYIIMCSPHYHIDFDWLHHHNNRPSPHAAYLLL